LSIFRSKYFQIIISQAALNPQKKNGATFKRIPNGFEIPNPELLNSDLWSEFGIYKSRGIGIGIPLGTTLNLSILPRFMCYMKFQYVYVNCTKIIQLVICGSPDPDPDPEKSLNFNKFGSLGVPKGPERYIGSPKNTFVFGTVPRKMSRLASI
jgi:hypothetical protein